MSWLQKRPQVSNPTLYYTVGLNKTLLVVGLGNPGKKYENTRHNIGYRAVEAFCEASEDFSDWSSKKDLKCLICTAQMGDSRVLVTKPTNFMNDSGESVRLVIDFYKIDIKSLIVIHDDLDIDFGQIRTRLGGSSGGHNGIKSISHDLSEQNYGRIRIGIGPKVPEEIDSKDFVLSHFKSPSEVSQLPNLYKEVNALLTERIFGGEELRPETRSFIV